MGAMKKLLLASLVISAGLVFAACEEATPENIQSSLATLAPTVDIDATVQAAITTSASSADDLRTVVSSALIEIEDLKNSVALLKHSNQPRSAPTPARLPASSSPTSIPSATPVTVLPVVSTPSPTANPTAVAPDPIATTSPQPTAEPAVAPVPTPTPSTADVIESISQSVVKLSSPEGSGSGWIFEVEDNYALVATNSHVLPKIGSPSVIVDGIGTFSSEILGSNSVADIAVVRICCSDNFVALTSSNDQILRNGDDVIALGYPLDSGSIKITKGVVSGFDENVERSRLEVQTDAALNSGNSGGPLITLSGEVVGINTSKAVSSSDVPIEGTGFAISPITFIPELHRLRDVPLRNIETPKRILNLTEGSISTISGTSSVSTENNVRSRNSFIRATFDVRNWNPDLSRFHTSWGLSFRATGSARYVVVLTTRESWRLYLEVNGERTLVDQSEVIRGKDQDLATGPEVSLTGLYPIQTEVSLFVMDKQGILIINGTEVHTLDLSDHVEAGQSGLVSGYAEDDQSRADVFYSVESWQISPIHTAYNERVRLTGAQISSRFRSGSVNGKYIARVVFTNPTSTGTNDIWRAGLDADNQESTVSSSGRWFNTACDGGGVSPISGDSESLTQVVVTQTNEEGYIDSVFASEVGVFSSGTNVSPLRCGTPNLESVITPVASGAIGLIIDMPIFEIWALDAQ
jgi:S1-C subfamily serine protease